MPNANSSPQTPGFFSRLWQGFLATVGTREFFRIFSPWVKWLAGIAITMIAIGSIWGLGFAPPDYLQGNSYRIIFIHVPAKVSLVDLFLPWQYWGNLLSMAYQDCKLGSTSHRTYWLAMCYVC